MHDLTVRLSVLFFVVVGVFLICIFMIAWESSETRDAVSELG